MMLALNALAFGSIAILAAYLYGLDRKFAPRPCRCQRQKRDERGRFTR